MMFSQALSIIIWIAGLIVLMDFARVLFERLIGLFDDEKEWLIRDIVEQELDRRLYDDFKK